MTTLATRRFAAAIPSLRFALGRRGDLTPSPLRSGSALRPSRSLPMTAPATRHKSHATGRRPATTPSLCFQVCPRPAGAGLTPSPLRSGSSFSPPRKRSAFTLIELLVVIAIIAILAGLAFPAVQGALGSGKKAQARNDVNQLAAAVKAFQLEYGRLPGTATADGLAPADLITTLTSSNSQNPRGIVFFEPKMAKGGKGGGFDGLEYKDPWGTAYAITLDYNYDNKLTNNTGSGNQTNFTTVIVQSAGPDTNMTKLTDNISNVK